MLSNSPAFQLPSRKVESVNGEIAQMRVTQANFNDTQQATNRLLSSLKSEFANHEQLEKEGNTEQTKNKDVRP